MLPNVTVTQHLIEVVSEARSSACASSAVPNCCCCSPAGHEQVSGPHMLEGLDCSHGSSKEKGQEPQAGVEPHKVTAEHGSMAGGCSLDQAFPNCIYCTAAATAAAVGFEDHALLEGSGSFPTIAESRECLGGVVACPCGLCAGASGVAGSSWTGSSNQGSSRVWPARPRPPQQQQQQPVAQQVYSLQWQLDSSNGAAADLEASCAGSCTRCSRAVCCCL